VFIPDRFVVGAAPGNGTALRLKKDVVQPNDATERPALVLVPDDPGRPAALVEGVVAKGQIVDSVSEILDNPKVFDVIEDVVLE